MKGCLILQPATKRHIADINYLTAFQSFYVALIISFKLNRHLKSIDNNWQHLKQTYQVYWLVGEIIAYSREQAWGGGEGVEQ